MTTFISQVINKYRGLASTEVVRAVENAAAKTGADFSFLMEKASAESGFNPAAQSKSSTAAGLFQFIESTWLHMVKEYGPKYGLGALAGQIKLKGGKPCVDDCVAKEAILNLRKNPEIAALMAGEFSAGNRQYLETHTGGSIGMTELYLAHFMGPGGAAKFLNSRAQDGAAVAAGIFSGEAGANKNVFFDPATGRARTLDGVYDFFAKKFDGLQTAELTRPVSDSPPKNSQTPQFRHSGEGRNLVISAADEIPAFAGMTGDDAGMMQRGAFPSLVIDDSFSILQSLPLSKLSAETILLLAQTRRREEDPLYPS